MDTSIAFRVDASIAIGNGHLMRCLALADALQQRGARCLFICRNHAGHLVDLIADRGYSYIVLPNDNCSSQPAGDSPHSAWLGANWATDAEQTIQVLGQQSISWVVVDHYALDGRWEQALRSVCKRIMVIDDLADRPHDCDLLLDQNLNRETYTYAHLVNKKSLVLCGPEYALLRPEFGSWRQHSLVRRVSPELKHLLICMGGVDQGNATGQILDQLQQLSLPPELQVTAVLGEQAPWAAQVKSQVLAMSCTSRVLVGVDNMAELMAESDLAIGAGGSSAWERCALGLPSLTVVLAENQKSNALALQEAGAALMIPDINYVGQSIKSMIGSKDRLSVLSGMAIAASQLVDGAGISRVVPKLLKFDV